MNFSDELKKSVRGEVRSEAVARAVYSVDASIYTVEPLAIFLPFDKEDLLHGLLLAKRHKIPLTARGAATGITGGALGKGLIIDTSKHLTKIHSIDWENEKVIADVGVIQDDLNRVLSARGYRLGANTSTGNRATLGGMFGNNAAGSHALFFGQMSDHILSVEMALADGTLRTFTKNSLSESDNDPLLQKLVVIRDTYQEEIKNHFPTLKRRVSGYNLDGLLANDLTRLLTGSEGTLGIATTLTLRIVKEIQDKKLYLLAFDDMGEAMQAIPTLLSLSPIAIEMIDRQILQQGKLLPTLKHRLEWLKDDPACVLAVEFSGENREILRSFPATLAEHPEDVWAVRKAGLEILLSKRSYQRAIAFIEDIVVSPYRLPAFMREFLALLQKYEKEAGIYGHVGEGCLHIRPYINLRDSSDVQVMETMMHEVSSLVLKYEGAMSGEHGDGLTRSWLNKKMFTPALYLAMQEVKSAFDPENLMNPGKKVDGPPFIQDLRSTPDTPYTEFKTKMDFSKEGGFTLAVDLCNGNGLCRKKEGLMCPSFQATGDEMDTTRARAESLRALIQGRLVPTTLANPALLDVLDLCLECKGCKRECPSLVDMAKMKAEVLYHHNNHFGVPLRSRLFGHIGDINQIASFFPAVATAAMPLLAKCVGITEKRPLPPLKPRFTSWAKKQKCSGQKKVVLFPDTFTEWHAPEVGVAAYQLLQQLGYQVIVPSWHCCGRTLVSKGLLSAAEKKWQQLSAAYAEYIQAKIPIILLEPSCHSIFLDEFPLRSARLLDEFLLREGAKFPPQERQLLLHTHCHQKALQSSQNTLELLSQIKGIEVDEIDSGCCGLAGSFGYEKEHYELSMQIGELKLFPAIRHSPSTTIIASGFSCRSQIHHGTGRTALHLAELIQKGYSEN